MVLLRIVDYERHHIPRKSNVREACRGTWGKPNHAKAHIISITRGNFENTVMTEGLPLYFEKIPKSGVWAADRTVALQLDRF